MPSTEKKAQKSSDIADKIGLNLVCTRLKDRLEIDVYIDTTGKWETIATVYSVNGFDVNDMAEFLVSPAKLGSSYESKVAAIQKVFGLREKGGGQLIEGERPTPREIEVMEWTAQGKTCSEIAMLIGVSHDTVKAHVENFRRKVNATNKTQAVVLGIKHGFIRLTYR